MDNKQATILIIFYSMYGHTFNMANAAVEGVKNAGGFPRLRMVAELVPEDKWTEDIKKAKEMMQDVETADPKENLKDIDGLVVATPTRYGNMAAQMRNFWDQTSEDWMAGTLIGKPGAVMTATGTQHGGQETTIIATMFTLLHHGMVIVGLPYSNQEQSTLKEITGGSPYGASTIAGLGGERMPSENELKLAKKQAEYLTQVAAKLKG